MTQTPLPECTEPSIGFVMELPWGFASPVTLIILHSPVPTCGGIWLFPVPLGAVTCQGHTLCTALLSLEVPGGASSACGFWLQCGTERLCGQCCA